MFRPISLPAATGLALLELSAASGPASAAPACPQAGFTIVEPKPSPATRPVQNRPHHALFVRREALTATADITEIKLAHDLGDTQLRLKFTPEAAARLHKATENHAGLRIAFVADKTVVSAVTWSGPYGMDADQGVQLSLGQSRPGLQRLVEAVRRRLSRAAP